MMIVGPVRLKDKEEWLAMRMALWPETGEKQHRAEMKQILSRPERNAVFVCEDEKGNLVGFSEVSLREWAEGCESSPVGYLEGWFVAAARRGQGIGRKLLAAAEEWARARGCTEMGSDTDLDNKASEAAHLKLGYHIAARLTAFKKDLA